MTRRQDAVVGGTPEPVSVTIPDKVYFRIGEVGRILGVETYVIRYWETEFKTVKPHRTRSDQRLYRKSDIEALIRIRDLLYKEKFTIAGAKKKLSRGDSGQPDVVPSTPSSSEPKVAVDTGRELITEIKEELREIRNMLA